jgi:hypothetical protein
MCTEAAHVYRMHVKAARQPKELSGFRATGVRRCGDSAGQNRRWSHAAKAWQTRMWSWGGLRQPRHVNVDGQQEEGEHQRAGSVSDCATSATSTGRQSVKVAAARGAPVQKCRDTTRNQAAGSCRLGGLKSRARAALFRTVPRGLIWCARSEPTFALESVRSR